MRLRKVLIIANQFPPMGGSGVQRTTKFVKYLNLFGYEPIVFTREADNAALKDETLIKEISPETKIIRTKAHDYTEWKSIFKLPGKFIARKLLIPDAEIVWAKKSFKTALNVIKENHINLVYTTSYPYSDHLLGLRIKNEIPEIKWVADFRDEWTNNPYTLDNPYNSNRTKKEKDMERSVLLNADALISNTPVMCKNFIKNNNLREDNFFCIPNGYDEEDFKGITKNGNKNDVFTLTYTGALYGRRKPDTLFQSIKELIDEGKIDKDKIIIRLIGNYLKDNLYAKISEYGLDNVVKLIDYMPHRQSIEKLVESDALLIIEGTGTGSDAFYTGKVFEYMNTNTPVIALLPKGGAAESLILKTNIGISADTDDTASIKKNILDYYNKWRNNTLKFNPNWDEIKKYERKEITKSLVEVFDFVKG